MATIPAINLGPFTNESGECVFDARTIYDRLAGDVSLIVEISEMFLGDYSAMLAEVEAAVAARDAHRLERAAHKLRGSIGNFSMTAAYHAAAALEAMRHEGNLKFAGESYTALEGNVVEFAAVLRQFVAGNNQAH